MEPRAQENAKARMNQVLRPSKAYVTSMAVTAKRPYRVSGLKIGLRIIEPGNVLPLGRK
jgi:hypothetical protein